MAKGGKKQCERNERQIYAIDIAVFAGERVNADI
jgi:hypothetical protein